MATRTGIIQSQNLDKVNWEKSLGNECLEHLKGCKELVNIGGRLLNFVDDLAVHDVMFQGHTNVAVWLPLFA